MDFLVPHPSYELLIILFYFLWALSKYLTMIVQENKMR